ncbi:MAG TPA: tetratricopeptide repeat protein [Proteobacteria bacterium]|nr:tetratricopeptide repeat protein [Pseudomonadota bacterium]
MTDLAEGLALKQSGHTEAAIKVFRKLLQEDENNLDARHHLGNALISAGQTQAGIRELEKVYQKRPADPLTAYNLGCALFVDQQFSRALTLFSQTVRQLPGLLPARVNRGLTLHALNRPQEALADFYLALQKHPEDPTLNWNLALTLLSQGHYREGWAGYEWRWRQNTRERNYPHKFSQPLWDGRPFPGKTLLVYSEQGFGDAIQFARFLPLAKARGGRLLFECRRETAPLFVGHPAIDEQVIFSFSRAPQATFDLQIPLLSLPRVLEIELHNLPQPNPPALKPDQSRFWRQRLAADHFNIGLVWAGQPTHANDRQRSCSLKDLAPLLRADPAHKLNLAFFSLQLGEARAQLTESNGSIPDADMVDCAPWLRDFGDSAALINELDLLITVDTAAAHLGGSLGRPVWVLLSSVPDWRWFRERRDSPWYPSLHLFRQRRPKDWTEPIAQMTDALIQLAGETQLCRQRHQLQRKAEP